MFCDLFYEQFMHPTERHLKMASFLREFRAARYEDLLTQGGAGIQAAQWLIATLLEAEVTDRHVRSIRYQMGRRSSRSTGTWPATRTEPSRSHSNARRLQTSRG